MFGSLFDRNRQSIRLVVGLNQVDKMIPNGWNERLNMPDDETAIERRSQDIISRLSKHADISSSNIEYYSALKRYRLIPLLSKIIQHTYSGFKLGNVKPADPFELADPDVRAFAEEERRKRGDGETTTQNKIFDELRNILPKDKFNLVFEKFKQENQRPPKVAIFGKAGVGKTTTINSLFNAQWKTSHTIVGTTQAQMKEFELSTGGTLNVVDLPGYGRSVQEDKEYEKIYRDMIPSCDLVFLVVQSNARDFADDEEMILKVSEWLKELPSPQR